MKQLTKLGSQGSRVLSGDQMKNIKAGGMGSPCSAPGASKFCAAALCTVYDGVKLLRGMCTMDCVCQTDA